MEILKLQREAVWKTRALWEEVFGEDTELFLNYYYDEKTKDNEIFAIEEDGELVSMLQLNPYTLCAKEVMFQSFYVIAVATKEQYRHRGYMSRLLNRSMNWLYEKEVPFTFLMPAAKEIYLPFGFQYIGFQKKGKITGGKKESKLCIQRLEQSRLKELCQFSNKLLKQHYDLYGYRDFHYYEVLLKEQESQNGHIMLCMDDNRIVGYFYYGKENKLELRELTALNGMEEQVLGAVSSWCMEEADLAGISSNLEPFLEGFLEVPVIMARIVHLPAFLSLFRAREEVSFVLEIEDEFLKQNAGIYKWDVGKEFSRAEKIKTGTAEMKVNVQKLVEMLFSKEACNMSGESFKKWKLIERKEKVFLNEIV